MPTSGQEQIRAIQWDLACPTCSYNLRGLNTDTAQCPECGAAVDIGELVSRRWTLPWHMAPWFNDLVYPAAWLMMTCIALLLSMAMSWWEGMTDTHVVVTVALASLPTIVIWLWLMDRARRLFGSVQGVYLALYAHAVLAGYLLALPVSFAVTIWVDSVMLLSMNGLPAFLAFTTPIFGAFAIAYPFRLLERHIANRCIRKHLSHGPDT